MKKYLFLLLCLGIIKILNLNFFTNEINVCSIISRFAGNLYKDDIKVSSEKIEVIDYIINDDNLIVIPAGDKVILPLSGIITDINNNSIKIESHDSIYYIYNVRCDYKLYQYYKAGKILGSSSEYIINSKDISSLVSSYILNYEAV